MKIHRILFALISCLAANALFAQPQIGGGTCSSASLNGSYSATLTGRDVGSQVTFSKVTQDIGTVTFDGLNKVAFSLINNTNQTASVAQTLSGTYSLQSNCVGVISIATGDIANFSIESYNQGKNFIMTGQDGVYAFSGSGSVLPAACGATQLSGTYAFNGSGYILATGAVTGVNNISGTLTFDGKSAATGTWFIASGSSSTTTNVSGQFGVAAGCTASATVSDSSGNTYTLLFTVTATDGSSFLISGADAALMFSGSGRTI